MKTKAPRAKVQVRFATSDMWIVPIAHQPRVTALRRFTGATPAFARVLRRGPNSTVRVTGGRILDTRKTYRAGEYRRPRPSQTRADHSPSSLTAP